ncbi:glycosyltransferase family 1 protein [Bacillus sp. LS15-K4]|nr:glycosyltransferase family 1 protein [Bacillus sp. LS15-K4]MDJ1474764.1 glycosyltransferase family 1 protein [Bacillus sp. LS15-K4]
MKKKKVLIDGFYLEKPRGLGRYVKELLHSLCKIENLNYEFLILLPAGARIEIEDNQSLNYIKVKKVPFPIWEQVVVPYYCLKYKADILLSPYNTFPLISKFMNCKSLITVHDLMFFDKDNTGGNSYQRYGNLYRRMCAKRIPKNAHIMTVSEKSSEEIQKILNRESKVIYTSLELFNKTSKEKIKNSKILQKLDVSKQKYFYHIGGISPHKNTERVIKAFLALREESVKLVISGLPENNDLKEKYQEFGQIVFTKWLEDGDIAALYSNALGIIFPSLMEGYGLPIVEGFTFKKPVITSNIDPMKEISGDAAMLIDPYNIDSIREAMNELLYNESLKEILLDKVENRRVLFSAKKMGHEVLETLNSM